MRALRAGNIVAETRRNRNRLHLPKAELGGEGGECHDDPVEYGLIEADQVHLVRRQHEVADA